MGKIRYAGNAEQAARLQSARLRAGYTSARAAAVRFGLSLARLRAHESGEAAISGDDLRHYAEIFGVDPAWLRGEEATAPRPSSQATVPFSSSIESLPAGRLRLARRLAGYRSVQAAADAHGWTRSRLSAHEINQNRLLPHQAAEYGRAFNVLPEWLLTGEGPSGYPPDVEADLPRLLALYDLPDSQARPQLPKLVSPKALLHQPRTVSAILPQKAGEVRRFDFEVIDEYDEPSIISALTSQDRVRKPATRRQWGLPPDFLTGVLGAESASGCFVLAIAGDAVLNPGDRVVIAPIKGRPADQETYAVCRDKKIILMPGREARDSHGRDAIVVGRVIGHFGRLLPHPRWRR